MSNNWVVVILARRVAAWHWPYLAATPQAPFAAHAALQIRATPRYLAFRTHPVAAAELRERSRRHSSVITTSKPVLSPRWPSPIARSVVLGVGIGIGPILRFQALRQSFSLPLDEATRPGKCRPATREGTTAWMTREGRNAARNNSDPKQDMRADGVPRTRCSTESVAHWNAATKS